MIKTLRYNLRIKLHYKRCSQKHRIEIGLKILIDNYNIHFTFVYRLRFSSYYVLFFCSVRPWLNQILCYVTLSSLTSSYLYLVIKASILVPTVVGSFELRYQFSELHASIFREGPGNDLQEFGKFVDGILFKACTSLTENRTNN